MNEIPGYDAWKLSAPEGPYPCDHCHEDFHDDDLVLVESGQFCRDCVPCETCGENVGEAQLSDDDCCKSGDCYDNRAGAQAEAAYERFHSGGGPVPLSEQMADARRLK